VRRLRALNHKAGHRPQDTPSLAGNGGTEKPWTGLGAFHASKPVQGSIAWVTGKTGFYRLRTSKVAVAPEEICSTRTSRRSCPLRLDGMMSGARTTFPLRLVVRSTSTASFRFEPG